MRQLILLVALLLVTSLFPTNIYAATNAASSAALTPIQLAPKEAIDSRVKALENVLEKYNSPLKPYAKAYVEAADKHGVDWRLLPSIAGLESSFGKHYIPGTYNVYGWGSGRIYFDSWEDGIDHINSKLKANYMDKWGAKDVWEIGPIYAESPTWAVRVNSFMSQIDKEYLAISTKQALTPNL
ncbi:MAG: glucosaminidase domain-containing protein [Candidatus Levybacteria bacterium]|nr:glucosaminidase domain-containing protein [Candidatus Levybacteria bacterium]